MSEKLTRTQFDVLKYLVKYGHIEREGKKPIEIPGRCIMNKTIRTLIIQNLVVERIDGNKTIYTPTEDAHPRVLEELEGNKNKTQKLKEEIEAKLSLIDPDRWKDAPIFWIQFKNGTFGTMRSRKTLDQLIKSGRYLSVKQLAG